MKKALLLILLAVFAVSLSSCGTMKKAERADQLELENADLQARIKLMEEDYEEKLRELEAEKDNQITMLERELGRVRTEKEIEVSTLDDAMRSLEQELKQELDSYKAKLQMTERGLVVTFLDEILFDSGKADIKPDGLSVLDSVAEVLNKEALGSKVAVEGNTDNVPIKYSGWKSNWELSSARALSVLHHFIDKKSVKPERLCAIGYGEYNPVVSNDTAEGRRQNRRVEIVIIPAKIKKVKGQTP